MQCTIAELQLLILKVSLVTGSNLLRDDRWWIDQTPVEWSIQCHYPSQPRPESSHAFCARTLQINCRPSSVRAVYQNVILSSAANEIQLTARVTGEQLETASSSSFIGLLAMATTGSSENAFVELPVDTVRLASHPIDEPMLIRTSYKTALNQSFQSVTLMAGCHGYVGSISISEIELNARYNGVTVDGGPCASKTEPTKKTEVVKFSKPIYLLGEPHQTGFGDLRDDVSLVTQVSMDRLGVLEHTLDQWDMPVSLVIYAPLKNLQTADDDWQRLYISKKVAAFKLHPSSVVSLVYAATISEQYPINSLRNIAVRQAHSRFLLLADADFQPSPELAAKILPLVRSKSKESPKVAIVIPAFEYVDVPHKSDVVAANKQELMQLLHAQGIVSPFRRRESPQSHSATDYWKWYTAKKSYEVELFSDKYEPYLVAEKNAQFPMYWEKFSGYGMNKISHMTELRVAGYSLWVSPNSWLIHVPHRLSSHFADHLQNATYRLANRALRFEFLHHLRLKYSLDCDDERVF